MDWIRRGLWVHGEEMIFSQHSGTLDVYDIQYVIIEHARVTCLGSERINMYI